MLLLLIIWLLLNGWHSFCNKIHRNQQTGINEMKKIKTIIKRRIYLVVLAVGFIIGINTNTNSIFAQENDKKKTEKNSKEKILFIDKDGDGINDILQHGWGLKLLLNKNKSAEEQNLNPDNKSGEIIIKSDNKSCVSYEDEINQYIKTFDKDGDGKPDVGSIEEIRRYLKELKQEQIPTIKDSKIPVTGGSAKNIFNNLRVNEKRNF